MVSTFQSLAAAAVLSHVLVTVQGFSPGCISHGCKVQRNSYTVGTASPQPRQWQSKIFLSSDSQDDVEETSEGDDGSIDINSDDRLRRIRLPRATGIEWGTDLSFSFVYVRDLEPSGAAALSGEVEVGDQICELRPVVEDGDDGEVASLIGAPFDEVMNAFASLGRKVKDVDLVFFRGTKDELKAVCQDGFSAEDEKITVTVITNKGSKDEETIYLESKAGCNVRQLLTDNGINVYQSVTRWTNCKGKQLCGTCIVNILEGAGSTNRKSLDEASTLRENPESYRLSCVSFAYGDITVETFPPIKAAQWTR